MHKPTIKISITGYEAIITERRSIIEHFQTFNTFLTTGIKKERKGIFYLFTLLSSFTR